MADKPQRYKIEKEIGRGAFGIVFLAHDSKLQRDVALKVMDIPEGLTDEEIKHLQDRFFREARAAASLSHPNIVIIHDISRSNDQHFISMEYLEGVPLSHVAKEPMDVPRVLELSRQMLSALEYAHSKGVIHRDVKPDNVFLLTDDRVKLVDFGLARLMTTTSMTRSGSVMGSPGYIAPEIIEGRKADNRTDIFSFGVVLYEMLTGERPFGPYTPFESYATVIYRILSEQSKNPSELNPAVEPWLDDVVRRCMMKNPDERFQNAGEVLEAIDSHVVPAPAAAKTVPAAKGPEGEGREVPTERMTGAGGTMIGGAEPETGAPKKRRFSPLKIGMLIAAPLLVAAIILGVLALTGAFNSASAQVKSPNLINLEEKDAVKTIEAAGLKVGKKTPGFSYDIWRGKIMRQFPEAGKTVPRGSSVDYWVSLGNDVVQVPDVVNEPEADATSTLAAYGLKITRLPGFNAQVPRGNVFEITPAPGTLVAKGDTVRMRVNTGVAPKTLPGRSVPTPRPKASQPAAP
jgi:eukaryotic-like serine/threonine-protein kinase